MTEQIHEKYNLEAPHLVSNREVLHNAEYTVFTSEALREIVKQFEYLPIPGNHDYPGDDKVKKDGKIHAAASSLLRATDMLVFVVNSTKGSINNFTGEEVTTFNPCTEMNFKDFAALTHQCALKYCIPSKFCFIDENGDSIIVPDNQNLDTTHADRLQEFVSLEDDSLYLEFTIDIDDKKYIDMELYIEQCAKLEETILAELEPKTTPPGGANENAGAPTVLTWRDVQRKFAVDEGANHTPAP
jgi:hypothetical protein